MMACFGCSSECAKIRISGPMSVEPMIIGENLMQTKQHLLSEIAATKAVRFALWTRPPVTISNDAHEVDAAGSCPLSDNVFDRRARMARNFSRADLADGDTLTVVGFSQYWKRLHWIPMHRCDRLTHLCKVTSRCTSMSSLVSFSNRTILTRLSNLPRCISIHRGQTGKRRPAILTFPFNSYLYLIFFSLCSYNLYN